MSLQEALVRLRAPSPFSSLTLKRYNQQLADVATVLAGMEDLEERLEKVRQWTDAYPIDIFTPPDLKKAHRVLTENGMTLDGISAHVGRVMIENLKRMVGPALPSGEQKQGEAK